MVDFHVKYVFFIWKLSRDDSGIVQDIYFRIISVSEKASKVYLWVPEWTFHLFENLNFQFSSKTNFFGHKFGDPVEYVRMDHMEHLGFQ